MVPAGEWERVQHCWMQKRLLSSLKDKSYGLPASFHHPNGEDRFFESVGHYFDKATTSISEVSPAILARIKATNSTYSFTFPIEVSPIKRS